MQQLLHIFLEGQVHYKKGEPVGTGQSCLCDAKADLEGCVAHLSGRSRCWLYSSEQRCPRTRLAGFPGNTGPGTSGDEG